MYGAMAIVNSLRGLKREESFEISYECRHGLTGEKGGLTHCNSDYNICVKVGCRSGLAARRERPVNPGTCKSI